MTSSILNNKKDWEAYKKFLIGKVAGAPHQPITIEPEKYPCLAVCQILPKSRDFCCEFLFFYEDTIKKIWPKHE